MRYSKKDKHKRYKSFIFIILICIVVLVAIAIVLFIGLDGFAPKDAISGTRNIFGYDFKSYKDINGNYTYFEHTGPRENIQLTVFHVDDGEVARIFIENHMTLFKSVFEPKRVDYPGQYTKTIECPPEYKPKYFEHNLSVENGGGTFVYFLGYANSNKVAGACSEDLIAYRHIYGMLNCGSSHKIVKIEYFTDMDTNADSIQGFVDKVSCKGI